MQQQIYFVGTEAEIGHHAAPLSGTIDFLIESPDKILPIAKPGDLAIFYTEHFDRFRNAIRGLKESKVSTLYMIDGILEWRNAWENRIDEPACPFTMRPVLSHKVACIGHSQARVLGQWGNQNKIEVVGIPRFDRLTDINRPPRHATRRILIMTAKCPSFTDEQHVRIVESLNDLKLHFDNRNDVEPIWRLTGDLDKVLGVENQLSSLKGPELIEMLQQVDAVITTPSTAALESMLLNLPTAIVDYTNCPSYVQAAWKITAKRHIESIVNELLEPKAEKLLFQQQQLNFEVCNDGNASQRMGLLINKMLEVSKEAISAGGTLEFPRNLVPVNPPKNADFHHRDLFPTFPEFQSSDLVELQAELAHARREINHLQNQLNQVRSELGQAHQIFDEINNHPVAGPIVKIRNKFNEFVSKIKQSKSQPTPDQT